MLGQLVAETTLDEKAKALRLGISNDEIASRITNDPNFRGLNGQFDHSRFEQIIRQAGFTETRFVEEQRRVILRRQIAQGIGGEFRVPVTAMTAFNQYQNEKRAIEYLALGPAQAGDIPAPTPEALGKYFEERKVLFRAPEYRKLTLLSMAPADLAKAGRGVRCRRQELFRAAQRQLRHARTPRVAPDRVPECGRGGGRA